jgi:hypothetical protein
MLRKILRSLRSIMKGEKSPIDIWYYIQGHTREILYYSKLRFLIRKHIQEQFEWRLKVMDKECYTDAQCKHCGCDIPALTLSNKQCGGKCYYPMMSKKQWLEYKTKILK